MTTQASDFGRVAVLMGGRSAEREVSLNSGGAVLRALQRRGVDALGIDAGADVIQQLEQGDFARAFIVLHGRGGEDGVIQGALETIGMPYTGSGVAGSALGMDKYRCKLVWQALGLRTPDFVILRAAADLAQAEALGFPLMVKPVHEGSSIGMARVDDAQALRSAWQQAHGFDAEVMAERWITGNEYTASILDQQVLPLIRLETPHVFYDYDAKYSADSTRYHCPAGLDEDREHALRSLAMDAFRAVGATGWGRVDMIADQQGEAWLIEVNTVPGMTDHSLVPMSAKVNGMDFDELVWQILEISLRRG